jgi:hypothetical protein
MKIILICLILLSIVLASGCVQHPDEEIPAFSVADAAQGWYYGSLDQKKPGTPETWEHKLEGTRSAQWFDPFHGEDSICPEGSECPECIENDSCEEWSVCVNRTKHRGCYAQCSGVYLETETCTEDELLYPDCLMFDDVDVGVYGNMGYHQITGIVENTCDKHFDYIPAVISAKLYDDDELVGETTFAFLLFDDDEAIYSFEANERREFSGILIPEGDYNRIDLEIIDPTYSTECHIFYSKEV